MEANSQTAKGQPKVTMSVRVKRAGSNQWEDGPEVHVTDTVVPRLERVKLRVYSRLYKWLSALQSKLEESKK